MAVQAYSTSNPEGGKYIVSWSTLANGDSGSAFKVPSFYSNISVHAYGTFGLGGTVLIEGSNESGTVSNWVTLNDPQGNPLSITTAKIEQILEICNYIRPRVSAGDGSTSLTIEILFIK